MTRRRLLLALTFVAGLVLLAGPAAFGSSDLYSNIGPGTSISGLADRYPIGNYALDQHFSAIKASLTGGIDASGIPSMIAFFLANLIWQITAFISNAVIVIFGFGFSLDLLNGSGTGGNGALAPVGQAISNLYAHTFGQPWAVAAITLTGCWAMWRALIQRRYTETAAALAKSLLFCLIALAIVARPDATIGQASRWTNQISTAFLSVTTHGDVSSGSQAKRGASDELFSTLVLGPWVALNFGGTEHCIQTGTGSKQHDPISVPVRPLPAGASSHLASAGTVTAGTKQCVSNTARYPAHFLRFSPGSHDRDDEYDAVNRADASKLPDSDPAKNAGTYKPAIVDKPITDAMEKGGQYQRLLLALVVLVGELGAFMLLGALAISVVLSQVVVLLLACFAPVALVAGIIPGRGHELFKTWATHLATYLVRKAAYSLVLAVVLAVLSALQDATSNLGWLMSFGLQAALLWTVFLQRHNLVGKLTAAVSGQQPGRDAQLRRLLGIGYIARTVLPATRRPNLRGSATDDDGVTPPPAASPPDLEPSGSANPAAPSPIGGDHTARPDHDPAAPDDTDTRGDRHSPTMVPAVERDHDPDHIEPASVVVASAATAVAPRVDRTQLAEAQPARRPSRSQDTGREKSGPGSKDAASPRGTTPTVQPAESTEREPSIADHDAAPAAPQHTPQARVESTLAEQLQADRQRLAPPPATTEPIPARRPEPDVDNAGSEHS